MMDADHLAALNRGYRKRDFTGWHDCGYRGYALDCGGFSVVYDEGEYFVRVRNNRIDVCARIGYISVEEREVIIEGDYEESGMYLSVTREPGKLRAMAGAPLRRPSDSCGGTYYNESWPELSETDPVDDREEPISYDLDYRNPERTYMDNAVKAIRAISCADTDLLDLTEVDGTDFRIGPRTTLNLQPEVRPRSSADIRCWLHQRGKGWNLSLHGNGKVGRRYGMTVDTGGRAYIVLTPWLTSQLDSDASCRGHSLERYLKENPVRIPAEDGPDLDDFHSNDSTYPRPWYFYWGGLED